MSDTEALNLIEHYKWNVVYNAGFIIYSSKIRTISRETLREAIKEAMNRQIEWATRQQKHDPYNLSISKGLAG